MSPRDPNSPAGGSSPSRKPQQARAGWRSKATAPGRYEPTSASRSWWSTRRSEPARNAGFRVKLALSIMLLTGLVGAFVYWLSKATKVPMVALAAVYETSPQLPDRPPNSWILEDLLRFETFKKPRNSSAWFDTASRGEVEFERLNDHWGKGHGNAPDKALTELEDYIEDVSPGGPGKDVILIYVSAHGLVDGQGHPCLLLENSNPLDERTWLPVKKLCESICAVKAQAKAKKVLVLDSNRIDSNGSCGVLYNDFADRLKELVEGDLQREDCQNLVVINSTEPGQVGWTAPGRGGSAFGYYFFQSLTGAGKRGGKLLLHDLIDDLGKSVNNWVFEHRQGQQRPMLLFAGKDENFAVATCPASGPGQAQEDEDLDKSDEAAKSWNNTKAWNTIAALWADHDMLKSKRLFSLDPLLWARLERGLLRVEQLLLSGEAYERERNNLIEALSQAMKEALERRQDIPLCSLPIVERFSTKLEGRDASAAVKPEAEAPASPAAERTYYRQARDAWKTLCEKTSLGPREIGQELAKIKARQPASAQLIEVHFLRMLEKYLDESNGNLELTPLAIKSRNLAEQAAVPADYRAHYWVTRDVNEGDQPRREAEDLLLVGPVGGVKDGTAFEDFETQRWKAAQTSYTTASHAAEQITTAFHLRDLGWAQLPYLAQWLWMDRLGRREVAGGSEKTAQLSSVAASEHWARLHDAIKSLRDFSTALDGDLAQADERAFDMAAWQEKISHLDSALRSLTVAFDVQSAELLDKGQTQSALVRIGRHLELPLAKADDRRTLRDRYLTFLTKDREEIARVEQGGDPSGSASDLREAADHPYLALLEVIGPAKSAKGEPASETAKLPWEQYRERLTQQGEQMRQLLRDLDKGVKASLGESATALDAVRKALENDPKLAQTAIGRKRIAELRAPRSQADLMARAGAAFCDLQSLTNPAPRLNEFDLHQFLTWQCVRTLDDFWGPAETGAKSYFAIAGGDLARSAETVFAGGAPLRKYAVDLLNRRGTAADELLTASSRENLFIRKDSRDPVELLLSINRRSDDLPPGVAAALVRYDDSSPEALVRLEQQRPSNGKSPNRDDAGTGAIRRIGVPINEKLSEQDTGVIPQEATAPDAKDHAASYWFSPEGNRPHSFAAVVSYRGHERPTPLPVVEPGPPIVFQPKTPPPPSIRVRGDAKVLTSIVFIFDCSASMKDPFPRGDGTTATRMQVAKETLSEILQDRRLKQLNAVGLTIYGHRFGFDSKRAKLSSRYAKSQEQDAKAKGRSYELLEPGLDVETAYSPEFLNDKLIGEMSARLKSLEPWGATPLYLAIAKVAEEFRSRDETLRIIAITDGFNNQESVTGQVTARLLEARLAGKSRLVLDIIGIGSDFSKREQRQDLEDLIRIARNHNGDFYRADNSTDLLNHIQKSLSLGKFVVIPKGEELTGRDQRFELSNGIWNESANARATASRAEGVKYVVRVLDIDPQSTPSMEVTLEGGEALELFLESIRRQPTLSYRYYNPNGGFIGESADGSGAIERELRAIGKIVQPSGPGRGQPARYWVAAQDGLWNGAARQVTFTIQVQNFDLTQFSPRPAEAWIEITPLGSDKPLDEVYRYCDLEFKSGTPVPRLVCNAAEFPHATCKKARVQLWFRMQPLPGGEGVKTINVKDLQERGESLEGVSMGAKVQQSSDGDVEVEIREYAAKGAAERAQPGRVKIEIVQPAKRIVREYEAGRHRFFFENGTDVERFIVRLTDVEKFKSSAIHCELPDVEITR